MRTNLQVAGEVVAGETITDRVLRGVANAQAGSRAHCTVVFTGTVADAEWFRIGTQRYELFTVATDTGVNLSSGFASGTTATSFTAGGAHGLGTGDIIRMENEYMLVTSVTSTTTATVTRGYAGSTAATHADTGIDIYKVASNRKPSGGTLPIPLAATGVAIDTAGPLMVLAINYFTRQGKGKVLASYAASSDTLTISAPHYFVVATTDPSKTVASGELNNGTLELTLTVACHGFSKNDVLMVGNEYLLVTAVPTAGTFKVRRGFASSYVYAQSGTPAILKVTRPNSGLEPPPPNHEAIANGTISQFVGGCDSFPLKKSVLARVITAAEVTAQAVFFHVDGAVVAASATVYNANGAWAPLAAATVTIASSAGPGPSTVNVAAGAGAWEASDVIVAEVLQLA